MPLVKSRGMGLEISVCQGNEVRRPGSSSINDEMVERGVAADEKGERGDGPGVFVLMWEGKVAV